MADPNSEDELLEVLSTLDPVQAQMARDLLQQAGIEAFVVNEEASRMLGTTPSSALHSEQARTPDGSGRSKSRMYGQSQCSVMQLGFSAYNERETRSNTRTIGLASSSAGSRSGVPSVITISTMVDIRRATS